MLLFLSILVMASALPPVQVDLGPEFEMVVESEPPEADAAMDNGEQARAERAKTVHRSGAEAEHFKAGLAEAKEQLSQAIAAATKMEEMTSYEANMLRGEAERARHELSVAHSEIRRLRIANAELEQRWVSLQFEARSTTERARQTQRISHLFDVAGSEAASRPRDPQARADPIEYEARAVVALSSGMTQPLIPGSVAETGGSQPIANAPDLLPAGPDAATLEVGSGLADLHASIQVLNELERGGSGTVLFSDVESVSGRAVHIIATPAWHTLPAVAKQTYLDTLLEDWVAAQDGTAPAFVRIVDPSGRVLIEKSSP